MVNFNSVQKIVLLGVIVAALPVVSLNMLLPRLALADPTKLSLNLVDLTIVNYTSGSAKGHTNTTTLDLWLEVGLPVKNKGLTNQTPSAPINLTATPGDTSVMLTWITPSSNGGSAITGYKVYQTQTSQQNYTLIASLGVVLVYNNTGLVTGTQYFYLVAATNILGIGDNSNETAATPTLGGGSPSMGKYHPSFTHEVKWDTRYYNADGSLNTKNLNDSTENVFVPQVSLTAKSYGKIVGTGGTVKIYQLNATHPVDYAHIYVNCSREDTSGLMFMFNELTQSGGLDNLLEGMLGGSGSASASALLNGLALTITAYAGSAPLTLTLGSSFLNGASEFPGIKASGLSSSALSPAAAVKLPFIHYDHTMNLNEFGSMSRFSDQLGFNGPDTGAILTSTLGLTGSLDIGALIGDLTMLFSNENFTTDLFNFTMHTNESWWIQPGKDASNKAYTIWTGLAYNNATAGYQDYSPITSMQDKLTKALAWFKATYDKSNKFIDPGQPYNSTILNAAMALAIKNTRSPTNATLNATADAMQSAWNAYRDGSNASSWYWRMFKDSSQIDFQAPTPFLHLVEHDLGFSIEKSLGIPVLLPVVNNKQMGPIPVSGSSKLLSGFPIMTLFELFHFRNLTLGDLFNVLGRTVPQVLTGLLFSNPSELSSIVGKDPVTGQYVNYAYGLEPEASNGTYGGVVESSFEGVAGASAVNPSFGSITSQSILMAIVILAFVVVFLLMAITKGTVRINRREFLSREDVQRNINSFIKQVEQLGGKVSVQNAESLVIRAFRVQGKIEKSPEVERRAKTYVENQKLLVTLQSRASRAYVAQKFKDCIAAIEKMIDIARKLEDQTLVTNYEDNLAKVVKLLRRKGISVSTKMRVEEGAQAGSEVEKLGAYKKDLIDLQNKASKLFAERNWSEAKNCIKEMLAIAKKIQDPVLIRNYEANLRKIISMEKGGTA